ncbi:MAG TPA: hypothetical protein VNZ49_04165 [Bacteroidia bacterium]|jgi:hypothetical protein|nr:hypothetical protein [Bacteroidia bacterium]
MYLLKKTYFIFCSKNCIRILFLAQLLLCHDGFSQQPAKNKKIQKFSRLSVGSSIIRTHLRNTFSDDIYPITYEGRLYFGSNDMFRGLINIESQPLINFKPEWVNIRSTFFDLQGNILFYFSNRKGIFYIIGGVSYQRYSGNYTGYGSISRMMPYMDKEFKGNYFGGISGFGFELKVYLNISLYAETRFRMMWFDEKLDRNTKTLVISDQLCVGIKINLPELHKIFRGPNDKYHWF